MPSDQPPPNGSPDANQQESAHPFAPPIIADASQFAAPPVIGPSEQQKTLFAGRLHPMTLVFAAWSLIRGFIIPAIVIFFVGNKTTTAFFLLVFLIIPLTVAVVRYFTFTYRLEGGELITAQGLLGRTERNIPLTRVQDIRIEQGVLHRMLNMADVNIETAGGRGAEASLSVLSKDEAERLRVAVFEQVAVTKSAAGMADAKPEPPPREIVRQLSLRELIVAGLTSNQLASVLALLAVGFSLLDDILPQETYQKLGVKLERTVESVAQQGIEVAWLPFAIGAIALLLVGIAMSVIGSVVLFYGFTLTRSGEDLHRSYGLLTRRASSLPRRRIQVLKIEEKALRRLFRLAALRADTAGSRLQQGNEGAAGRDVLLPIVPRNEVERLLPEFFPDLDTGEAEWRRVSRKAITRGTFRGGAVLVLIAAVSCAIRQDWIGLWPLLFLPVVFGLNVLSYRHLGYWLAEKFFRTRRGWLSRATHIVPIRNTQAILIRQTPFDRRHRVATITVDTAGQAYTGGGPKIDNVPWDEAVALARTLAQRAAETRYRW